ncbi:Ras-related protein RABH1c [Tritrichomonas foetus]|uniref:Ras-related protein RABH1c n=1 Tax=Tritrichomonas foetus TaxID=1144522 RepID=A0A1J4KK83_9EUKA|nr:Ras-related protein RABH1c [Tritrichomonas foetus]|eukprot:OHT11538.1 Ras-related protein RABH1c [Tritrichomonas foetus]
MKAILCGNSTVGKTSILNALTGVKDLGPTTPTLGAGCAKVTFQFNNQETVMNLWDTAGQEAYRSLIKIYFHGVKVAILIFDISNRQSFDDLDNWINDINESCDREGCPILLVANKIDLIENRIISAEEISKKAHELNCPFIEASALTRAGLKELLILAYRMGNGEKVPIDPTEEFLSRDFRSYEAQKEQSIELTTSKDEKGGCCG